MKKKKGSIALSLVFVLLISFTGLSILTYSVTHLRITKARKLREESDYILYNTLFLYLHRITKRILDTDISGMKNVMDEFFNKENFPEIQKGNILITTGFSSENITKDFYEKIRGKITVNAHNSVTRSRLLCGIKFTILSGDIPAGLIHFLITGHWDSVSGILSKTEGINLMGRPNFPTHCNSSLDLNINDFLDRSFSSFSGDSIINKLKIDPGLREKFKLQSNIFFYSEGAHKKNILINENIDEMIFAFENGTQIIRIVKEGEICILKYSPGEIGFNINFSGKSNDISKIFGEKIIVNGDIVTLKQQEDIAFSENSDIILTVFGNINIYGDLKTYGNNPDRHSPLTIVNISNPFLNQLNRKNSVSLTGEGISTIDVSIISSEKVINLNITTDINGILVCSETENHGIINIHSDFHSSPVNWIRVKDITALTEFFIDYIEKNFNED